MTAAETLKDATLAMTWMAGLTKAQRRIFRSTARFRVVVAGRRFGKTVLAINELLYEAQRGRDRVCWYVAPTYRQAKQLVWEQLKRAIPRHLIAHKDETDLSIRLRGWNSTIALRGADNPDSLRGVGLDFLVLDEFADIDPMAWQAVLRPALSDRRGRALFIGTPKGFNWAYDLFMKCQTTAGWESFQFTTAEGGNVPLDELEAARTDLDPRIYRQEYEASFESLHGRVYSNFDRSQWPVGNVDLEEVPDDGVSPLYLGIDFNILPMSCVIARKIVDECYVVDALRIETSNTDELCQELRRRYPTRQLIACPDPSGKSRKTSAPVGQTDFTILQQHGIVIRADSVAPSVVDRINATQAALLAADGRRRVHIHPRAKHLIHTLDGLTYKENTSIPDKTSGLDHMGDAFGYLVWQEFNTLKRRAWSVSKTGI